MGDTALAAGWNTRQNRTMLDCLLYRKSLDNRALFYRVEIAMTLFSDISVLREWGVPGGRPRSVMQHFGNWRDASVAADKARDNAQKRGYVRASLKG